jgi:hypothetical protein
MPRQLIYTSVPRGLTPGQSGYCTVARSHDLRDALIPRIEKISYYTPEPNHPPTICAHRILDVRGAKFHVLSRILDAGHDFTRRRCFLAHHLIFEPAEISTTATPAEIFLRWKGWIDQWPGDPQWLEDNRPLPSVTPTSTRLLKGNAWITGDETDRKKFLPTLAARGADWDVTFTNCFQPGDNATDFDIKAAWPNTPGYDAARKLDATFIPLDELQATPVPEMAPAPRSLLEPARTSIARPDESRAPRELRSRRLLPFAAILLTLVAFVATLYLRHRPKPNEGIPQTPTVVPPAAAFATDLNICLPDRPTWLMVYDRPAPIPPADELMRELRANDIFTKDLTCTLQTNLFAPALPAALFAQLDRNLIQFTVTNSSSVALYISNSVSIKTSLANSCAVEIPDRFRLLLIKTPVELSRRLLLTGTNIELHSELERRVHRLELPSGAQLALRPLVESKSGWIDPLASAERDFALISSTVLDLPAVHAHAAQLISDKQIRLKAYEDESAAIAAEQKKILTDATPEQLKAKDRLAALQLAIAKGKEELESLRARAASIPHDPAGIDRFAIFLCLSNVNTEIFRFTEKP